MLRPAEDSDLDAMRAWRNQGANREVSLTSHEIAPEEHRAWWARTKTDPTRRVLIFEVGGADGSSRPMGVVNFFDISTEDRSAAWGFFLDNDTVAAEGLALTAWMSVMKEATAYAFDEPPNGLGVDLLTGEVLAGNEAVRSMNRRFRFTEGASYTIDRDGEEITVHPISLRRQDRRGASRETRKAAQ